MKHRKIAFMLAVALLAAGYPTVATEPTLSFGIAAEAATAKLEAPTNIKAVFSNGKITVTWSAVNNADGYRIYKYDTTSKKYVKYKTVKGTTAVIDNIVDTETVKLKVAAYKKNGKKVTVGNYSAAVTVNTATPETTSDKPDSSAAPDTEKPKPKKLKEVKLSLDEMAGSWEYYDFRYNKKYNYTGSYNPEKKEAHYVNGWISQIQFVDKDTALFCYDDDGDLYSNAFTSYPYQKTIKSPYDGSTSYYKTFSYGDDYYLFLQFVNGRGVENTYVFKKKTLDKIEVVPVKKVSELNGTWKVVDFCPFALSSSLTYDPTAPGCSASSLYISEMEITNGKACLYPIEYSCNVTLSTIDNGKYYIYNVGSKTYLYYQWISGDGSDQFYVFQKS